HAMPNPVSARDDRSVDAAYDADPADDAGTGAAILVCGAPEEPLLCTLPIAIDTSEGAGDRPADDAPIEEAHATPRSGADYMTLRIGLGAFVSGSIYATVDRHGHVYVGAGAGVGLSPALATASLTSGQLLGEKGIPDEATLERFARGDALNATAGAWGGVAVTNSAGGTAFEVGLASPQISAQFEHGWRIH
ncbi:MAG TPA: hypothetical protein VGL13_17160, partial [Polyangiaceae bacterium]